jgi:hypothetical protein
MTAEQTPDPLRLPGAVTLEREPDGLVLRLTGEVDAAVVDRFRWAQAASTDGRPVLLRRSARCVDRVLQQMGLDAHFHS